MKRFACLLLVTLLCCAGLYWGTAEEMPVEAQEVIAGDLELPVEEVDAFSLGAPDVAPETGSIEDVIPEGGEAGPELVAKAVDAGDFVVYDGVLRNCYSEESTLIIPDDLGITEIASLNANNRYTLKSIVLPSGVKVIRDNAFLNYPLLESVTLPDTLEYIGDYAFKGCPKLKSCALPDGVESIGKYAFSECVKLNNARIPSHLKSLGERAFYKTAITSAMLPDCLTEIGAVVFSGCASLKSARLPAGIEEIPNNLFNNCQVAEITIPEGVTSIGAGAFKNCPLTRINIPKGVTSIGEHALSGTNIKELLLPEGLTFLGGIRETQLKALIVPDSVTRMSEEEGAYWFNKKLVTLKLPARLESGLGDQVFLSCEKLTSVIVPEGVTKIGRGAFNCCFKLQEVRLPDTVTAIGSNAFSHCTSLKTVNLPDGIARLEESTFNECASLKSIRLPASTQFIGLHCFESCAKLTTVILPEGVTEICAYAFSNCPALNTVYIGPAVQRIGHDYDHLDPRDRPASVFSKHGKALTIYGQSGSPAQSFAKAQKIPFEVVDGADDLPVPDAIRLSEATLHLGKGETIQLRPEVFNRKGHLISAKVTYATDNKAVAKVNDKGKVTAKSAGTATIRVSTANGVEQAVEVTVTKAPKKVTISETSATLQYDRKAAEPQTLQLSAVADTGSDTKVTFSSSNERVATVSGDGLVTAVGGGTAKITAKTYNKKSATCTIKVIDIYEPDSVVLPVSKVKLAEGQQWTLAAALIPETAETTLSYKSSNKKTVAVNSDGIVTAKKTGKATITVSTANGKKATCEITVKGAPKSISVSAEKAVIGVGEQTKASARLSKDAWSPIEWNANGAATVDEDGNIVGLSAGTATVTGETINGLTDTVEITVLPAAEDFTLSAEAITLKKGKSAKLKVILPEGTAAGYTFESNKPKVAEINAEGRITAKSKGTSIVTVTLMNGITKVCNVTVK